MKLWLGEVPEYTVIFVQSMVFLSLAYAVFEPIRIAVLATNKITEFMLIPDAIYMLILPLGYIVGNFLNSPSYFIICIVVFEIFICWTRILYASKVTIFQKKELAKKILLPCLFIGIADSVICGVLSHIFNESLFGLIALVSINCLCLVILVFWGGLSKTERNQVKLVYTQFKNNKNKNH